MSQTNYTMQPQPVAQPTGSAIFDFQTDAERVAYMRALGAKNTEPPLVRSTHLRVKATGQVHPWNELMAEQSALVDNCDEFGNTDPDAWAPEVNQEEYDENEKLMLMAKAKAQMVAQREGKHMHSDHAVQGSPNPDVPLPMEYPNAAVPYDEIEKLVAMLED